jgi:hypothetical protein
MPLSVAYDQVICPGSAVPGPPRAGPRKIPGLMGPDRFTEATSNAGGCAKAAEWKIRTNAVEVVSRTEEVDAGCLQNVGIHL